MNVTTKGQLTRVGLIKMSTHASCTFSIEYRDHASRSLLTDEGSVTGAPDLLEDIVPIPKDAVYALIQVKTGGLRLNFGYNPASGAFTSTPDEVNTPSYYEAGDVVEIGEFPQA